MESPPPKLFEPQYFVPLFVVGWFCLTAALSYIAGWTELALRFRSNHPIEGERFWFASGCVGASTWFPVCYRNCLFITVGESGFLMSVFFLFRFLSPPLFIPWFDVESITEQRFWFVRYTVIRIRGFSTKIMVTGRARQGITRACIRLPKQDSL